MFEVKLYTEEHIYSSGETSSLTSGHTYVWTCAAEGVAQPVTLTWTFVDSDLLTSVVQADEPNSEDSSLWDSLIILTMTADWSYNQEQLWCNASASGMDAAAFVMLNIIGK